MTTFRSWWRNCALEVDDEIQQIDLMEDKIAPISADSAQIRELISSLELCHHKAEQWVYNIVEAIGSGKTNKGLGTRMNRKKHPAEKVWVGAYLALSAWSRGVPARRINQPIGNAPGNQLLASLGERTPLKVWQVDRVVDKIRSVVNWARNPSDTTSEYKWMLLSGGEYESAYRSECPDYFKDDEEFWFVTARTMIQDTVDHTTATLSLALAIDMLWPCHWRFLENLRIVLNAIGGNLKPHTPFAACGRNIYLVPNRERLETVCNSLKHFQEKPHPDAEVDFELQVLLGAPTDVKKWLAASLDKTIRLQLNPPEEIRDVSSLVGPEWIS